uniref:RMI1_C domain-containing protein n=1 Tax=Haemonchus placei TaxID=6290 RepID=A0A0N4XAG2_HAEPC
LATTLNNAVQNANAVQRTTIQLLFDCRVLHTLFPDEKLRNLVPVIESRIDPFDLSLLSSHLSTNVRLAVSRSQLLYSCLLVDIVPTKEGQGSAHYSQVVDVVPKSEYSQRIPLIPRLDRTAGESVTKRVEATRVPRNKLLANSNLSVSERQAIELYEQIVVDEKRDVKGAGHPCSWLTDSEVVSSTEVEQHGRS